MLKKRFGLISASFFGVALLFAVIFCSVVSDSSQVEFVVLRDETMTQLIGGIRCEGTRCEKGSKVQRQIPETPPFAVDCTGCPEDAEKIFEPRIYSCRRCDRGEVKHIKVRLCRKRKSYCATFGYEDSDPPCRFKSDCVRKSSLSLWTDDCESPVTPRETCI